MTKQTKNNEIDQARRLFHILLPVNYLSDRTPNDPTIKERRTIFTTKADHSLNFNIKIIYKNFIDTLKYRKISNLEQPFNESDTFNLLQLAATEATPEIIATLIKKGNFDLSYLDNDGKTALDYAVENLPNKKDNPEAHDRIKGNIEVLLKHYLKKSDQEEIFFLGVNKSTIDSLMLNALQAKDFSLIYQINQRTIYPSTKDGDKYYQLSNAFFNEMNYLKEAKLLQKDELRKLRIAIKNPSTEALKTLPNDTISIVNTFLTKETTKVGEIDFGANFNSYHLPFLTQFANSSNPFITNYTEQFTQSKESNANKIKIIKYAISEATTEVLDLLLTKSLLSKEEVNYLISESKITDKKNNEKNVSSPYQKINFDLSYQDNHKKTALDYAVENLPSKADNPKAHNRIKGNIEVLLKHYLKKSDQEKIFFLGVDKKTIDSLINIFLEDKNFSLINDIIKISTYPTNKKAVNKKDAAAQKCRYYHLPKLFFEKTELYSQNTDHLLDDNQKELIETTKDLLAKNILKECLKYKKDKNNSKAVTSPIQITLRAKPVLEQVAKIGNTSPNFMEEVFSLALLKLSQKIDNKKEGANQEYKCHLRIDKTVKLENLPLSLTSFSHLHEKNDNFPIKLILEKIIITENDCLKELTTDASKILLDISKKYNKKGFNNSDQFKLSPKIDDGNTCEIQSKRPIEIYTSEKKVKTFKGQFTLKKNGDKLIFISKEDLPSKSTKPQEVAKVKTNPQKMEGEYQNK